MEKCRVFAFAEQCKNKRRRGSGMNPLCACERSESDTNYAQPWIPMTGSRRELVFVFIQQFVKLGIYPRRTL